MGKSNGYFFFVLNTQGLAVEEEAANSHTKEVKTNEHFVEGNLGIWQIRTRQGIRMTGKSSWRMLLRNMGRKEKGC